MNETPTDIAAGYHRIEREELHLAQDFMCDAATAIDRAARAREKQGDQDAARDAATYRECARLLRGERDGDLCLALAAARDLELTGIMQILRRLDVAALLRMIRNDPP